MNDKIVMRVPDLLGLVKDEGSAWIASEAPHLADLESRMLLVLNGSVPMPVKIYRRVGTDAIDPNDKSWRDYAEFVSQAYMASHQRFIPASHEKGKKLQEYVILDWVREHVLDEAARNYGIRRHIGDLTLEITNNRQVGIFVKADVRLSQNQVDELRRLETEAQQIYTIRMREIGIEVPHPTRHISVKTNGVYSPVKAFSSSASQNNPLRQSSAQ